MKKLILTAAIVAAFMGSCKKEPLNQPIKSITNNQTRENNFAFDDDVSYTEQGWVRFHSFVAYYNVTEGSGEMKQAFRNYLHQIKPFNVGQRGIGDQLNKSDLLREMLNDENIVEVAANIIKLDFLEHKVYVLSRLYIEYLDDLKLKNTTNEHVKEYSMDEEVINILENEGDRGLFCKEGYAHSERQQLLEPFYVDAASKKLPITGELHYWQGGILFQLYAEGYMVNKKDGGVTEVLISTEKQYKARCQNWIDKEKEGRGEGNTFWYKKLESYESARALSKIDYKVQIHCRTALPTGGYSYAASPQVLTSIQL